MAEDADPWAVPPANATEEQFKLTRLAEQLLSERRVRHDAFGDDAQLFGDPAWEILLALYCARGFGAAMDLEEVCHAAKVPRSSGLRWIDRLMARDLVLRAASEAPEAGDRFVASEAGVTMMTCYLRGLLQS